MRRRWRLTIKLLASSKQGRRQTLCDGSSVRFSEENIRLYSVNDVFNAIFVHGNVLGDAMFYGSGAGKLPTASAVVADVVDEAKHLKRNIMTMWESEKLELLPIENTVKQYFVRISGKVDKERLRSRSSSAKQRS